MKQEIIRRSECGVKQCDLVKEFGLNKTTILTNKDAIKSAKVAKGVSKLFNEKHRSSIHEEMERLLAIWIKDRQVKGDVTTQDIICHKAKIIYEDLKKNIPGSSSNQDNKEDFKASRGWFFRFKKRYGIHSVNMHGEAGSADKKEAEKFSINFQKFIMDEGYCPQQVFNADETGCEFGGDNMTIRMFWKEKFDILLAIRLIQKAWEEVSQRTLISAWKMLVALWIQEEAVVDDTEVVKDIITVAQRLELEVEEEDVEELIEEHKEELTTEELQTLLAQQQDNAQREASSDNEEQQSNNQPIPTADIKNILVKWKAVQEFTNAHYPDSAEANRINDLYSDTLVRYFRQMLKKREKQTTLDRFFTAPSAKKRKMDEDVQDSNFS
ncbi:tigger transposable element-derived protein 1-like protein [Trichonephila clavata]|uniref:Tigger transposable element-derived protein 1-like protein n=1 Tax=Trichonephila clavata TaxID=2740835 RepID=A0A8X6GXS9_TRICU|nr:tigger transposable element-derived protein 1-like protein [Trichonephila clavata]